LVGGCGVASGVFQPCLLAWLGVGSELLVDPRVFVAAVDVDGFVGVPDLAFIRCSFYYVTRA
jgi:hypothetical protein